MSSWTTRIPGAATTVWITRPSPVSCSRAGRCGNLRRRSRPLQLPSWPSSASINFQSGRTEMLFGSGIKLDKALLAKVKRYADLAGYSSVEEFITHALEKEIAHLEEADSPEEIKKRLKGLGYIS